MDYTRLSEKKNKLEQGKDTIDKMKITSCEKEFELTYAHHSTAMEGNSLTLEETRVVLEDGISIGGKRLKEIYEVVNHQKAFRSIKKYVAERHPFKESIVKELHAMLTDNCLLGGIYRNQKAEISGACHTPPVGNDMLIQIKNFYAGLSEKKDWNPIVLAAWSHADFTRIHPFADGNGRTARLIMNYHLMINGFLPVSIAKENRSEYYQALEEYAVNGNLDPFTDIVAELEEARIDAYLKLQKQTA